MPCFVSIKKKTASKKLELPASKKQMWAGISQMVRVLGGRADIYFPKTLETVDELYRRVITIWVGGD